MLPDAVEVEGRIEADEGEAAALELLHAGGEGPRSVDHVGIGEEDEVALEGIEGRLHRVRLAEPAGSQRRVVDDADARILGRDGVGDLAVAVRRVVVDDHDAEPAVPLGEERTQGRLERELLVARGHDDAIRAAQMKVVA